MINPMQFSQVSWTVPLLPVAEVGPSNVPVGNPMAVDQDLNAGNKQTATRANESSSMAKHTSTTTPSPRPKDRLMVTAKTICRDHPHTQSKHSLSAVKEAIRACASTSTYAAALDNTSEIEYKASTNNCTDGWSSVIVNYTGEDLLLRYNGETHITKGELEQIFDCGPDFSLEQRKSACIRARESGVYSMWLDCAQRPLYMTLKTGRRIILMESSATTTAPPATTVASPSTTLCSSQSETITISKNVPVAPIVAQQQQATPSGGLVKASSSASSCPPMTPRSNVFVTPPTSGTKMVSALKKSDMVQTPQNKTTIMSHSFQHALFSTPGSMNAPKTNKGSNGVSPSTQNGQHSTRERYAETSYPLSPVPLSTLSGRHPWEDSTLSSIKKINSMVPAFAEYTSLDSPPAYINTSNCSYASSDEEDANGDVFMMNNGNYAAEQHRMTTTALLLNVGWDMLNNCANIPLSSQMLLNHQRMCMNVDENPLSICPTVISPPPALTYTPFNFSAALKVERSTPSSPILPTIQLSRGNVGGAKVGMQKNLGKAGKALRKRQEMIRQKASTFKSTRTEPMMGPRPMMVMSLSGSRAIGLASAAEPNVEEVPGIKRQKSSSGDVITRFAPKDNVITRLRSAPFAFNSMKRSAPEDDDEEVKEAIQPPLTIKPAVPSSRPPPKKGTVEEKVYSKVPVYELVVGGTAVMRRKRDSYVNATHLLKVAGFEDKAKRTKVLEREVGSGEHEKVQGGFGRYQGTWVPLERAKELAAAYGATEKVAALLNL
ncbi:transcriptional regulator swi6 [Chytridiales sp. JEL 0842]|nr:transcriptional regulator swi6 [Chytridiales sp. JEL 0842]